MIRNVYTYFDAKMNIHQNSNLGKKYNHTIQKYNHTSMSVVNEIKWWIVAPAS